MVREVRDQIENILTECGVLVEEVVQVNLAEEGQGNMAPNEPDLEPEECGIGWVDDELSERSRFVGGTR